MPVYIQKSSAHHLMKINLNHTKTNPKYFFGKKKNPKYSRKTSPTTVKQALLEHRQWQHCFPHSAYLHRVQVNDSWSVFYSLINLGESNVALAPSVIMLNAKYRDHKNILMK